MLKKNTTMMRFTYLLVAGLLAFNVSQAQELKGPKAKNYKPWKEQARTGSLAVNAEEPSVKGPAFKNKNVWKSQAAKVEVTHQPDTKEHVTGPKAKNRKIWKKD
jgi:hypothetical protein